MPAPPPRSSVAAPGTRIDLDLLALHYLRAGDNNQAWKNARAAARLAQADFAIGDAVVDYGRALEAARHLDGLSVTDRVETLEAVGDLHERMGRYDHAAARFTEARRLVPDDPVARAGCASSTRCSPSAAAATRRRCAGFAAVCGGSTATPNWPRLGNAPACRPRTAWCGWPRVAGSRPSICSNGRSRRPRRRTRSRLCAHAYFCLDWALSELGRGIRGGVLVEALKLYRELGELGPQAVIYNNLGTFYHLEGRWDEAVAAV